VGRWSTPSKPFFLGAEGSFLRLTFGGGVFVDARETKILWRWRASRASARRKLYVVILEQLVKRSGIYKGNESSLFLLERDL
jgi:hypothetical protein